jgi:hypothetical protein
MKNLAQEIMGDYGRTVPQRIPLGLLVRIENFEKEYRFKNRTDAINKLLEIALKIVEHKEILKDEHLKQEITNQLREGGLVDYFTKLSNKEIEILHSIVRNEFESRK